MNAEQLAQIVELLKTHLRIEREPRHSGFGCGDYVLRVYFADVPITETTIAWETYDD